VAGALWVVRARGGQHLELVSGRHVGEALAAYGRHLDSAWESACGFNWLWRLSLACVLAAAQGGFSSACGIKGVVSSWGSPPAPLPTLKALLVSPPLRYQLL